MGGADLEEAEDELGAMACRRRSGPRLGGRSGARPLTLTTIVAGQGKRVLIRFRLRTHRDAAVCRRGGGRGRHRRLAIAVIEANSAENDVGVGPRLKT
jgi:hypothetical protein